MSFALASLIREARWDGVIKGRLSRSAAASCDFAKTLAEPAPFAAATSCADIWAFLLSLPIKPCLMYSSFSAGEPPFLRAAASMPPLAWFVAVLIQIQLLGVSVPPVEPACLWSSWRPWRHERSWPMTSLKSLSIKDLSTASPRSEELFQPASASCSLVGDPLPFKAETVLEYAAGSSSFKRSIVAFTTFGSVSYGAL